MLYWVCLAIFAHLTVFGGFMDQWTSGQFPGNTYYDIAFGNGTFVGVGQSAISTSSDGLEWTHRPEPSGNEVKGIAYGHGIFAAVTSPVTPLSGQGNVLISTNGQDWEIINIGLHNLEGIAFADGMFVAVGRHLVNGSQHMEGRASFFRSGDGKNWEYQYIDLLGLMTAVTWHNGIFVAVGELPNAFGVAYWSPDGANWHQAPYFPASLQQVTGGKGLFVATGNTSDIFTSTDGANWSSHPSGLGSPLELAAFANGTFFIGNMYQAEFAISADGTQWSRHEFPGGAIERLVFGKGKFVGIGYIGNFAVSPDVTVPLLSLEKRGQTISIQSSGEVGKSYQIQQSQDLSSWSLLKEFTHETTVVEIEDQPNDPTAFYRVTALRSVGSN
jgi:hypothetical protein